MKMLRVHAHAQCRLSKQNRTWEWRKTVSQFTFRANADNMTDLNGKTRLGHDPLLDAAHMN